MKDDFEQQLRHRLVGLLHAGRLSPGDRLESIRSMSRKSGIDHRVVAKAYRALAADGLVEIREGSGVYVPELETEVELTSERVRWVAEVLHDGWERRWTRGDVGRLVRRAGARRLLCACIDTNEDHMVAFASELSSDFELTVRQVYIDPAAGGDDIDEAALAGVDIVVTSVFHAEVARRLSARTAHPVVVMTIGKEYSARVEARLRRGGAVTVAVDPEYLRLGEMHLAGTAHEGKVELLLLPQAEERGLDVRAPHVLLTRAARRRLGLDDFHLIPPPPGVISSASARVLLQEITRLSVR